MSSGRQTNRHKEKHISSTMMDGTISGQRDNEEGKTGRLGRMMPPLPTLRRNFSEVDNSSKSIDLARAEVAHADSRDEPANDTSAAGIVDAATSTTRMSSSATELDSISKTLEERGVSNDLFILMNPRELYDSDPAARQLWDVSKRWEPMAARPKPVYPHSSMEGETIYQSGPTLDSTPEKSSSDDDMSSPCQLTSSLNSHMDSPNGFRVQSNLFIPIRDSDNESCSEVESRLSGKQLDIPKSPIPRLKLRPRGNQIDLSMEGCGFS
jgi:hypothetical protein